jgi:hypothetical protein
VIEYKTIVLSKQEFYEAIRLFVFEKFGTMMPISSESVSMEQTSSEGKSVLEFKWKKQ